VDIKSRLTNEIATLTVLDLWYAAHGARRVGFSYADVIGAHYYDDWLMQNMALVAKVVYGSGQMPGKGRHAGKLVQHCGPYGVSVGFIPHKQMLDVGIFLKDDDGNTNSNAPEADTQFDDSVRWDFNHRT